AFAAFAFHGGVSYSDTLLDRSDYRSQASDPDTLTEPQPRIRLAAQHRLRPPARLIVQPGMLPPDRDVLLQLAGRVRGAQEPEFARAFEMKELAFQHRTEGAIRRGVALPPLVLNDQGAGDRRMACGRSNLHGRNHLRRPQVDQP